MTLRERTEESDFVFLPFAWSTAIVSFLFQGKIPPKKAKMLLFCFFSIIIAWMNADGRHLGTIPSSVT